MASLTPFHLALAVPDLERARAFYGDVLGCAEGRSAATWIDFNFYGHQLVVHQVSSPAAEERAAKAHNSVDGHHIPVPHFGVVLHWQDWQALADRLKALQVDFIVEPHIRFAGQVGEQATLFFCDPFGHALEFKAFKDLGRLFAQ